jgi:hypothetical protein
MNAAGARLRRGTNEMDAPFIITYPPFFRTSALLIRQEPLNDEAGILSA